MAKKKDNNELTPFEEQFLDVYFRMNFNGRLAMKSLKPHLTNESADVEASRLLSSVKFKDAIEMKQEQIRLKEEIELSWIIKELKNIVLDVNAEQIERDPVTGKIYDKPDRKSKIAALQQLAKIGGFETKKIDLTSGGEKISINFTD